jgi:hypothetical protein
VTGRAFDRLPGGFAPGETNLELRLPERLFTPQEADLATCLTLDRMDSDSMNKKCEKT